jgi:hypothetical protein
MKPGLDTKAQKVRIELKSSVIGELRLIVAPTDDSCKNTA